MARVDEEITNLGPFNPRKCSLIFINNYEEQCFQDKVPERHSLSKEATEVPEHPVFSNARFLRGFSDFNSANDMVEKIDNVYVPGHVEQNAVDDDNI